MPYRTKDAGHPRPRAARCRAMANETPADMIGALRKLTRAFEETADQTARPLGGRATWVVDQQVSEAEPGAEIIRITPAQLERLKALLE